VHRVALGGRHLLDRPPTHLAGRSQQLHVPTSVSRSFGTSVELDSTSGQFHRLQHIGTFISVKMP
jgi:hypothetical protein